MTNMICVTKLLTQDRNHQDTLTAILTSPYLTIYCEPLTCVSLTDVYCYSSTPILHHNYSVLDKQEKPATVRINTTVFRARRRRGNRLRCTYSSAFSILNRHVFVVSQYQVVNVIT